jgi:hypothetical protein
MAIAMIVAVGLSSPYVPSTYAGCQNYTGHHNVSALFTWEANLSRNDTSSTTATPQAMCEAFVECNIWTLWWR